MVHIINLICGQGNHIWNIMHLVTLQTWKQNLNSVLFLSASVATWLTIVIVRLHHISTGHWCAWIAWPNSLSCWLFVFFPKGSLAQYTVPVDPWRDSFKCVCLYISYQSLLLVENNRPCFANVRIHDYIMYRQVLESIFFYAFFLENSLKGPLLTEEIHMTLSLFLVIPASKEIPTVVLSSAPVVENILSLRYILVSWPPFMGWNITVEWKIYKG